MQSIIINNCVLIHNGSCPAPIVIPKTIKVRCIIDQIRLSFGILWRSSDFLSEFQGRFLYILVEFLDELFNTISWLVEFVYQYSEILN